MGAGPFVNFLKRLSIMLFCSNKYRPYDYVEFHHYFHMLLLYLTSTNINKEYLIYIRALSVLLSVI